MLIEKRLFGPVPAWRTEFVEPEAIWLLGTAQISSESAAEVERVVQAVKPDNVVVELCRSSFVLLRKCLKLVLIVLGDWPIEIAVSTFQFMNLINSSKLEREA